MRENQKSQNHLKEGKTNKEKRKKKKRRKTEEERGRLDTETEEEQEAVKNGKRKKRLNHLLVQWYL
jgi:hypothetical protein